MPKPAPAVPAHGVEPRQQVVLAGDPLQFETPSFKALAAKFGASNHRFSRDFSPINLDRSRERLISRSQESAVARRQAHQQSQLTFGNMHAAISAKCTAAAAIASTCTIDAASAEGILDVFLKAEELLPSLAKKKRGIRPSGRRACLP